MFSALREGRQPRFLSRLPLSALDSRIPADLSGGLETLSKLTGDKGAEIKELSDEFKKQTKESKRVERDLSVF